MSEANQPDVPTSANAGTEGELMSDGTPDASTDIMSDGTPDASTDIMSDEDDSNSNE